MSTTSTAIPAGLADLAGELSNAAKAGATLGAPATTMGVRAMLDLHRRGQLAVVDDLNEDWAKAAQSTMDTVPPRPAKTAQGEWHECSGWEKRHPDPLPRHVACQGWAKDLYGPQGLCHNCSAAAEQQKAADARKQELLRIQREREKEVEQFLNFASVKIAKFLSWIHPDKKNDALERVASQLLDDAIYEYGAGNLRLARDLASKTLDAVAMQALPAIEKVRLELRDEAARLAMVIPAEYEEAFKLSILAEESARFASAAGQCARAVVILRQAIKAAKEAAAVAQRDREVFARQEAKEERKRAEEARILREKSFARLHPDFQPRTKRGASRIAPRIGKTARDHQSGAQKRLLDHQKDRAAKFGRKGTSNSSGPQFGGGHSRKAKHAANKRKRQGS